MRKLPIRWGLSLPNRGPLFGLTTVDAILNAATLADDSGVFDSVWFGESLIHKPRLEAVVMLSAVAARTQRVRLGAACMAVFPFVIRRCWQYSGRRSTRFQKGERSCAFASGAAISAKCRPSVPQDRSAGHDSRKESDYCGKCGAAMKSSMRASFTI